jgi:glycosyltransferase involved in cell wall biosynthesis
MINEMVSIIIPSYGRPDFLIRAVESTLNQDYKNIEIIVINDNAADSVYFDETNIALKKFSNDARVKVLATGVNVGGSVARNQGITYSSGEYVTFLDDDDFYFKNKVSRQIEHLNSEKLDVSVCDMFVDDVIKQKKDMVLLELVC